MQKDYVIQAVRTPPKEEQKEDVNTSKLASIDEEWITTHASQVAHYELMKGVGGTEGK